MRFETLVEKTKKRGVELQDNANPNTYLSRNQAFLKILTRTRQRVLLEAEKTKSALTAVNAYGIAQSESIMSLTLHFEKEIQCEPKPFLM